MLLTSEEYQRGLVRWTSGTIREVRTGTSASTDNSPTYSEVLTDSEGSISKSAVAPFRALEFCIRLPEDDPVPCRISWDRVYNGDVETLHFDAADKQLRLLDGVLGLEKFRRLVISVPFLNWNEDRAIRQGNLLVRFFHDHAGSSDEVPDIGKVSTAQPSVDQRRIEILAPEAEQMSYELAFAVLGLVALHVGDAAIGDVVHNETREYIPGLGASERSVVIAGIGSRLSSSVSPTLRLPVVIPPERFERLDRDLRSAVEPGKVAASLNLALRWYEQSIRFFSEPDRLLSSVVGIEALVTRLSAQQGFNLPIAELLKDKRIPACLSQLIPEYGEEQVSRLLRQITNANPNIRDRIEHFSTTVGWGDDRKEEFEAVARLRNDLVHGSTTTISRTNAMKASRLLAHTLHAYLNWAASSTGQTAVR